ncbi:hypothetical protein F4604DRAFT_1736420 [Suillus subluteus]|nr:hypothetical protein F4604DRAFT_1736420 [Suillus subluteus]
MLRQNIMCRSDSNDKDPFPNFNIPHRCRNFEKVLSRVDEHRVFGPKSKVVRLEDNVDLASPPRLQSRNILFKRRRMENPYLLNKFN